MLCMYNYQITLRRDQLPLLGQQLRNRFAIMIVNYRNNSPTYSVVIDRQGFNKTKSAPLIKGGITRAPAIIN